MQVDPDDPTRPVRGDAHAGSIRKKQQRHALQDGSGGVARGGGAGQSCRDRWRGMPPTGFFERIEPNSEIGRIDHLVRAGSQHPQSLFPAGVQKSRSTPSVRCGLKK
jgi:hypothetical protein